MCKKGIAAAAAAAARKGGKMHGRGEWNRLFIQQLRQRAFREGHGHDVHVSDEICTLLHSALRVKIIASCICNWAQHDGW